MTSKRPDIAMVLAAGRGERMRPLTDTMPKPLVQLEGRALIDHALDRLAAAGIRRAVVNVHYRADQLEAHVRGRSAPDIIISDERDALLETGGGVVRALPLLGERPFIIHNSDTVWIEGQGCNLERLINAWDAEQMDTLLLLAPAATSLGYDGRGDFSMDANGRLERRRAGEVAPFVFAGVSIAHPRMFIDAPQGAFSLNVLWSKAIIAKRAYGVRLEGTWMHVGTPGAIAEAEAAIRAVRTATTAGDRLT